MGGKCFCNKLKQPLIPCVRYKSCKWFKVSIKYINLFRKQSAMEFCKFHLHFFGKFLLFLVVLPSTARAGWNIFENCDIHFVIPTFITDAKEIPSYFDTIREQNPYTPLIISFAVYDSKIIYTNLEYITSLSRLSVVIVNLNLRPFENWNSMSYSFQGMIFIWMKPKYFFAHVSNPLDPAYYKGFSELLYSSTLILWNSVDEHLLYVPCIPCPTTSSIVPINLVDKEISLMDIHSTWDALNRNNMHNKFIRRIGTFENIYKGYFQESCGPNLYNKYYNFYYGGKESCVLSALTEKHNLSIVTEQSSTTHQGSLVATIYLNILLKDYLTVELYYYMDVCHFLEFKPFQFFVLTDLPSSMGSIAAFISPFDRLTWILILSSCIGVTMVIETKRVSSTSSKMKNGQTCLVLIKSSAANLFKVSALFFNQIAGNLFPNRLKTFASIPLLCGWIFGCFILTNNLYGGAIFSCLTVSDLPQVPRTLEELADSNLFIQTSAYFISNPSGSEYVAESTLRDQIIPDIIQNVNHTSLLSLVHKILNKILFPKDLNFKEIHGHKLKNLRTIAMMEDVFTLKYLAQLEETIEEGRLVFRNREETPFQTISGWWGSPNFFSSKTSLCLSQLIESGIYYRWKILEPLKYILHYLVNMDRIVVNNKNRGAKLAAKFFAKSIANTGIHSVVFNEKEPVSFLVVKYVLILCALMEAIGLLAFAFECKESLKYWGRKLLWKCKSLIRNSKIMRAWKRKWEYLKNLI